MIHLRPSSYAGKRIHVELDARLYEFDCIDWWDRAMNTDKHWHHCTREDMVCMEFVLRHPREELPWDDEILLGTINGVQKIIHATKVMEG